MAESVTRLGGTLLLTALLIGVLSPLLLRAQATSTITGLVKDATGAVIRDAQVQIESRSTASLRQTQTNESGRYQVTNLVPGAYEVTVFRPGFKTSVTRTEVTVGQVAHLMITLEVGEISEQVTVTGSEAPVDVEQGRVSSLVDGQQILDLPLNGRNVYKLIHLTPGAVDTTSTVWELGAKANINGGRANMNGFWLDGVSTTTLDGGTGNETEVGGQPSLEAIQEFRIETLNFSAEFGGSAASVVNVVSKSGSNRFHGSLYAFHRNDNLDAREFFDEQKPEFKQNQFGFSLGGPLIRDRTFFFGSYEGTRIRTGESKLKAFESREWSGFAAQYGSPVARYLFANHPAPELDSITTTVGEYLFDSGYILSPVQSDVDAFLEEFFGSPPGALSADATMIGEAGFFTPDFSDTNAFSVRIDQELGQTDRLYGRYFSIESDFYWPTARPGIGESILNQTHLAALNWTHVLGPHVVNEARAGYTRYVGKGDPTIPGMPWIGEAGWNTVFASGGPENVRENIFTWADTLSLMTGNHGFKMGVEIRRSQQNSESNAGVPSYYFFDLIYLALDDPYYQGGGVDPRLDEGPGQAELASNARGWRGTEVGLFLNDDWKLLPNLTLNLGLRWDWFGRLGEVQGRGTAFDLVEGRTLQERIYNGSFVGVNRLTEDDWNNFSPRLGFAWDPSGGGRMSLRGGYGIAFQSEIYNPLANSRWNKPYYSVNSVCPVCGYGNSILYGPQDGSPVRVDGPNINPGASSQVGNIIAYDGANPNQPFLTAIPNPKMRDPYVQSFFFGIQRELFAGTTVEANYVGTLGRKLLRAEDFNRYPGDHLGVPNPVTGENAGDPGLNRINSEEGVLRFWENSVNSNYNALQVQVNHRYGKGLAFTANYTLAKSLDTRSTWHSGRSTSNWLQEGYSTDVSNQRLDYGRSVFDAQHRFTASWLWEIPWRLNSDHWLERAVLGGWQLNGILSLQSGQPFTPYCGRTFWAGCDWNADGSRNDRPNTPAVGNSIPSSRSDFVNPNSGIFDIPPTFADRLAYFGQPESGSNGTLGRNTYEGPGFSAVDFSVFKEIRLRRWSEEAQLQIRFEFFNLFNRVNFFQPEPDLGFSVFGRSTEAFDAREIQIGIKILF